MPDQAVPEVDRRTHKEKGFFGHIAETLIGKQSRKVAFGIWLFIVANGFKARTDMPWDIWWKCVLLSGALIGLGTVLDDVVAKIGDTLAVAVGTRIKAVVETKTSTTVTTEVPNAPPAA